MTPYRPPSFWTGQEYCAGKPINRMMKRSEESITPLTPTIFHSPHHGYRFFANALNDVLPSPVILNGARILCGETGKQNDETERWICYPSWLPRFSILLITAIDSSLHSEWPLAMSVTLILRQKGWQKSGKCLPLLLTSQTGRIFHLHG